MTIKVTATEAKAKFLSLLDDADRGEIIEVTKHGRTVARIVPARDPNVLRGKFRGLAGTNASDEELFSTNTNWTLGDDGTP